MTLPGGKRVLLTRQRVQIKENEMILPREKKRKTGTRKNSQTEEEKERRYNNCTFSFSLPLLLYERSCMKVVSKITSHNNYCNVM